MFDYVDTYIEEVKRVDAVIKALSPTTRTMLDETGAAEETFLLRVRFVERDEYRRERAVAAALAR
jgi:hypothetical protein